MEGVQEEVHQEVALQGQVEAEVVALGELVLQEEWEVMAFHLEVEEACFLEGVVEVAFH